MGSEKYQRSFEDNRAAQEHLTPKQAEATEKRESVFNANETTTNVPGALMKMKESGELKEGPFEQTYVGEINGHRVTLTAEGSRSRSRLGPTSHAYQVSYGKFSAVVDGIEMSPDESKKIFMKFGQRYMSEGATEEDIKRIKEEQRAFQIQEIKKDLGI